MTKESLAAELNGREYGDEMTEAEELEAKRAGLVVVFGYSDDNTEFRGAINDELGCYNGGEFKVDQKGVLPEREQIDDDEVLKDYFKREENAVTIEALWCKEKHYSWTYKTSVTHATFDIMEDGGKYCRGIVINLKDLPPCPS